MIPGTMPSERVQRRIDAFLDDAESALGESDWDRAREASLSVLAVDPDNEDAKSFLAMAEPHLDDSAPDDTTSSDSTPTPAQATTADAPSSFADGRYEVSNFLGEGGKKMVYLAHDTTLDRDVAFALIKTDGLDDTSRQRITREAQAMGRMGTHPHVMTIFDLGEEYGQPFVVTEVMDGGDVEGLIDEAEDGRLSLEHALQIASETCRGLEFAHSKQIIHRDLKPGNVMLTADGTAKIGDFGLAVSLDRSRLTQEKMMVGTVSYMPPEQATGGEITPRADLYSLGAMLYEMTTGRPPFMGDDEIAIIGQHINTPPVAPQWHRPEIPATLDSLIMRLLSKNPAERPDSAADVLNALEAIDATQSDAASPSPLAGEGGGEGVPGSLDSMASGVFVGRHAEMDRLKASLENALSGRGCMVTLVGEPGIGKTRTSLELQTYAGLRNATVLWGRCYEGTGAPPYWPWVQAIRGYVSSLDPEELRSQMGSTASVISEIVDDVKQRLPETEKPAPLDDPESARFRLFDSIATFLKNAGQAKPLVLILDDLHWSDQPSLLLLEFIARELVSSRVMIIGTYRDMELNRRHPLTVTLGDLSREHLFERVLLRGLTREDVGRFIEIAAGVTPPASLIDAIHTQSEGNPLFVTEIVRLFVQDGELTPEKLASRESWDVRTPEGVREVIGRRLDKLSERTNEVLTAASIIGRQFTLDEIDAVSEDTTRERLLDVIDEGLAARVIEEYSGAVGQYQFSHAVMQETLADELSLTRRVTVHARIAEALETLYADDLEAHSETLAYHFDQAQTILGTDKLIHFSAIAGREALDKSAYEAAAAHLKKAATALEGLPMSPESALIFSRLGHAQIATGDDFALRGIERSEATTNLTRAFNYFADNGMKAEAIEIAARPHNISTLVSLESVIRRAIDLTDDNSHDFGRVLVPFSWILAIQNDREAAASALGDAIAIAGQHNDPLLEMRALAMKANIAGFEYRHDESISAAVAALELASSNRDPESAMRARLWYTAGILATGLGSGGEVVDADKMAHDFLRSALDLGHRVWVARAVRSAAAIALARGDWEAANEIADSVVRYAPREASEVAVAVGLWTGDFDAVRSSWDKFLEFSPQSVGGHGPPRLQDASGGAPFLPMAPLEVIERPEDIVTRIRRTYAESPPFNPEVDFPSWVLGRMRFALIAGREDEVRDLYASVVDAARDVELGAPGLIPQVLGQAAAFIGDTDAAITHFEKAEQICRNRGYRAALAAVSVDVARALRKRGQEEDVSLAEEREDEAVAIAQELGMKPLLERVLAQREILKA